MKEIIMGPEDQVIYLRLTDYRDLRITQHGNVVWVNKEQIKDFLLAIKEVMKDE